MEELNKNQIVLLTLLVSFVTSIATGIVTVTLMDQAPQGVTQTINRIVERTIERVVPGETQTATIIKEVPVIVTDEDLIIKAINAGLPAVVKLSAAGNGPAITGSGFIISETGLVVSVNLSTQASSTRAREWQAVLADGSIMTAELIPVKRLEGDRTAAPELLSFYLLRSPDTNNADTNQPAPQFTYLELATEPVAVGATIIAIGAPFSSDEANIAIAKVSGLSGATASSTPNFRTAAVSEDNLGAPLLNTRGKVVGISQGRDALALSVSRIVEMLTKLETGTN